MDLKKGNESGRRRGEVLEEAILAAAWDQLLEGGYHGFTVDAVARRAQTSKPVLYRRWPQRAELLAATLAAQGAGERLTPPDTGSLREDTLALLRDANSRPERFLALLSAQVGGLYDDTGLTPDALRRGYLGDGPTAMSDIAARAVARGEMSPQRATPRVISVPFDLLRMQIFLTFAAVPDDEIIAIVDEVFLPLATTQPSR